ncbi:MAG TPA: 2-amino-4-hydroxy-6-hydroxymethyldihydropteridine diphosphokinase [Gammaproteobacteria bacterium]|nr:2-amino-4-hydroxy-6-hydroxymethyldihydropteridine diphosphokinase [Gammaproteobacteria bacterium]
MPSQSHLTRAYVGLGSNLDNPPARVRSALGALDAIPGTCCVAQSSLYRSTPLGPPGQPDYVNAVAALDTHLSAATLLAELQKIEAQQGRVRGGLRWGPRTLDLDLLLFGEERHDEAFLTVPHPGLPRRNFVLYPLAEIVPELAIPGLGSLRGLIDACPGHGLFRLPASP